MSKEKINKGRKYQQVISGARSIFLSEGFEAALRCPFKQAAAKRELQDDTRVGRRREAGFEEPLCGERGFRELCSPTPESSLAFSAPRECARGLGES